MRGQQERDIPSGGAHNSRIAAAIQAARLLSARSVPVETEAVETPVEKAWWEREEYIDPIEDAPRRADNAT
jgi:hypothetical protein